jgi:hypothetical protein
MTFLMMSSFISNSVQQFPVKKSRQANRRFRKIFQFIFRKEYDLGQ